MSNILDKYGIKEVADVTFYEIDSGGAPGKPVLYLDTLKVSTIEQTAETTSARGGKGNPEVVMWDYGKEITLNLEDALFSAKSMALMYGIDVNNSSDFGEEEYVLKTVKRKFLRYEPSLKKYYFMLNDQKAWIEGVPAIYDEKGNKLDFDENGPPPTQGDIDNLEDAAYVTGKIKIDGQKISISADRFPGTYYITGDTYARSSITGEDEFFQFIIPKAKMQSEVTLTMEAEGDPSTFGMNLKVLRPANGQMMKLVKYVPRNIIASGVVRNNVDWSFDEDGLLIFSSKTATDMANQSDYPWLHKEIKDKIKEVVVQDFVRYFGTKAFYQTSLERITIGNSVEKVGSAVFKECPNLHTIEFGNGCCAPYYDSFSDTPNLTNITVAPGNPYIYVDSCGGLVDLGLSPKTHTGHYNAVTLVCVPRDIETYIVPEGIKKIAGYAFDGCNKLKYIDASAYEEGTLQGLPDVEYIRWKGDA